ncbi:MAG: 50S ribosomal protein L19e [Methanoregulaceae archaeon PtaU1.Bin059]|jgi:large subunit ribosomal protein L19e|nr:MAG: 50S ribosomal protein L19e [Methanoregulaceae archaeon PtaB.Bin009]OPY39459.1 MAG: 50S ribosomal protein L19e [Methanoregulaceae archaeon PtaU1.Bin059]HII75623.1 50S ribosomal protein L19e [Methanolinea sp.]HNS82464.1 50S ribosomal protein L19e [Methanolinea sp.]
MTDLSTQKRVSASIMKCGVHRVWFDPERTSDIQNAISREDLRTLIDEDAIRALQPRGNSRGRAREKMAKRSYGHCKGPGRRKGAAGARSPRKREWIKKIRAIRKTLADLRDTGEINPHLYRTLYRQAAGGQFRSVAHLKAHLALISGRMK